MAQLNDEAQWLTTLGFIISILILFLALIVNQSVLVGKTTSESVLEFPKNSIQDLKSEVAEITRRGGELNDTKVELYYLALYRENSLIYLEKSGGSISIHYNDGRTVYNEIYQEDL